MKAEQSPPATIDAYIAAYPPKIRAILRKVRQTIRKAAPDATERIAYRMPSFELHGALVYFGGFKEHVGFYPPVRDARVKKAAAPYANEKGNLQFPYRDPIPYDLITQIVEARVLENQSRAKATRPRRRAT